jgi:hypothetical protein
LRQGKPGLPIAGKKIYHQSIIKKSLLTFFQYPVSQLIIMWLGVGNYFAAFFARV